MKIAIIDYNAGNLASVTNALAKIGVDAAVVRTPAALTRYDKIILPGVGAAGPAMRALKAAGFAAALPQIKKPVLGICLGLQLFADFSEEGDVKCLGIMPGRVQCFPPPLKVPQIGWNRVRITRPDPLLRGIADGSYFYFVNSYFLATPAENILGTALYGFPFAAITRRENFYATQFHPEKSGVPGLTLLNNFLKL